MNSEAVRAGTIFITGISASGKSTLGKRLQEDLLKSGVSDVKLLDGEEMRKSLQKRGRYIAYAAFQQILL